jgi:hypothetical protein
MRNRHGKTSACGSKESNPFSPFPFPQGKPGGSVPPTPQNGGSPRKRAPPPCAIPHQASASIFLRASNGNDRGQEQRFKWMPPRRP